MPFKPVMMMVRSPAQSTLPGPIALYEQTWVEHVQFGHSDVDEDHVREALTDPCYIHESKTRPHDTVVFTNENCTNHAGDPLWVPVRMGGANPNFVTSAYYKENGTPGSILWRRGDAG